NEADIVDVDAAGDRFAEDAQLERAVGLCGREGPAEALPLSLRRRKRQAISPGGVDGNGDDARIVAARPEAEGVSVAGLERDHARILEQAVNIGFLPGLVEDSRRPRAGVRVPNRLVRGGAAVDSGEAPAGRDRDAQIVLAVAREIFQDREGDRRIGDVLPGGATLIDLLLGRGKARGGVAEAG